MARGILCIVVGCHQAQRERERGKRVHHMEDREHDHDGLDTTNVFVKYLPPTMNDLSLQNLFSLCGVIVSAKVIVDPHTWKSLGYG